MVDKTGIINLYKEAKNYVLGQRSCILGNLFARYISNKENVLESFLEGLDGVKIALKQDLDFFMTADPAIDNEEEVVLCYPGYLSITNYRIAHELYKLGYKVEARIISEEAHGKTGIDIHPGASISSPFFIDHGTGIVIGETTSIGTHCKIYQGVTLGALSLESGSKMKGVKRHPTVKDHVTIYSGASILGGDVVIGSHSTIGGNVFLTESIPENSLVTIGKPNLVIKQK